MIPSVRAGTIKHQGNTAISNYTGSRTYPSPQSILGSFVLGAGDTQCKLCFQGTPYLSLRVRVPQEVFPAERRIALTPQNVTLLRKKGFIEVLVKHDTGTHAQLLKEDYEEAGTMIPHNFGCTFSFPTPSSVMGFGLIGPVPRP
jgi:hypothetical protein